MFTETKSRLGWRTGASRLSMKQQLESLQSFDPAERARSGQQLVQLGLTRSAEALLDHVANEFDNRVLAAIAGAVIETPAEPKESRKAQQLREWAAAELERSALEEAFMGGGRDPIAFPPEPDFQSAGLEPAREPLPVRVPVAAVAAPESTFEAPPEPIEYRFEVPEAAPVAEPIEYRPAEHVVAPAAADPIEYRFAVPEPQAAPEPIEYRFDAPAPVAEYQVDPPPSTYQPEPTYEPETTYEPEATFDPAPPYISWSPPADAGEPSSANGNGHGDTSWGEPAADDSFVEARIVDDEDVDADPSPEPVEYRFDAPAPIDASPVETIEAPADDAPEYPNESGTDNVQEYRFESPAATDTEEFRLGAPEANGAEGVASTDTNTAPRTLAERLRAREA